MVKSYEITSFSSRRQHNISNTVFEIFRRPCLKYYKHGVDVGGVRRQGHLVCPMVLDLQFPAQKFA